MRDPESTTSKITDVIFGAEEPHYVVIYRHRIRGYFPVETCREYRNASHASAGRLAVAIRDILPGIGRTLPFATGWNWHRN